MNFKDLKDGQKVNVYIPAMKRFYKMDVTLRAGDADGSFSVSNYGAKKNNLIDSTHEFLGVVKHQNDVDNFFYMQKEPVTGKASDTSFKKAELHYKKNKRSWIY